MLFIVLELMSPGSWSACRSGFKVVPARVSWKVTLSARAVAHGEERSHARVKATTEDRQVIVQLQKGPLGPDAIEFSWTIPPTLLRRCWRVFRAARHFLAPAGRRG
jgi:hypothetical protein